jgi:hypothetical protein
VSEWIDAGSSMPFPDPFRVLHPSPYLFESTCLPSPPLPAELPTRAGSGSKAATTHPHPGPGRRVWNLEVEIRALWQDVWTPSDPGSCSVKTELKG